LDVVSEEEWAESVASRFELSVEGKEGLSWEATAVEMLDNKGLDTTELGIIKGVPAAGVVLRDVVWLASSWAGKDCSSKMTCREMYTHLVFKSRHWCPFWQLE